ncbi:MAG: RNA-binding S4 domain-containing protein [Rhizobiaceae bacterium]|nr:RNA-binding S4 domain-containing protein [Rhizobiaceae bacterium]
MPDQTSNSKLRVDKWLWYARILKTRTLAASCVKTGKVRVNQEKISSASRSILPGDVLTVTLGRQIKVLRILQLGSRRGPASEAQLLYEDLSPAPVKRPPQTRPLKQAVREEGAGRPTKKQRREMSRFRSQAGEEY